MFPSDCTRSGHLLPSKSHFCYFIYIPFSPPVPYPDIGCSLAMRDPYALQSLSWLGSQGWPHKFRQNSEHTFPRPHTCNVFSSHSNARLLWSNSNLTSQLFSSQWSNHVCNPESKLNFSLFFSEFWTYIALCLHSCAFPFWLKSSPHASLFLSAPPGHLCPKQLFLNAQLEFHTCHDIFRDHAAVGIITESANFLKYFISLSSGTTDYVSKHGDL